MGQYGPIFAHSQPNHNRNRNCPVSNILHCILSFIPLSKNPSYALNLSRQTSLELREREREWRLASTLCCSSERRRRPWQPKFTLWSSSTSATATSDALTKPSASSALSSVRSYLMAPSTFATLMLFLTASPPIRFLPFFFCSIFSYLLVSVWLLRKYRE